jgi:hypothetical protein
MLPELRDGLLKKNLRVDVIEMCQLVTSQDDGIGCDQPTVLGIKNLTSFQAMAFQSPAVS